MVNNKTQYFRRALMATVFALCSMIGFSQTEDDVKENTNLDDEITFTGTLDLFLKDANKLMLNPKVKESVVEIPSIRYSLIPVKTDVAVVPRTIKPAKVVVEESLAKLYHGYIKAGFGLYTTPLVEAYYMDQRSRKGSYNIKLRHLSSAGSVAISDTIQDRFSENSVGIWGKRFIKKHTLEVGLDWKRNVLHYFGYHPFAFDAAKTADAKQSFDRMGGKLRLQSFHRDSSDVNYVSTLGFDLFQDNFNGNEYSIDVDAHGQKYINTELFSADFDLNYSQFAFDRLKRPNSNDQGGRADWENMVFSLQAMAATIHKNWDIKAGIKIAAQIGSNQDFHFYPVAEGRFNLVKNIIVPYAGVTGGVQQNTYESVAADNPFVLTDLNFKNTNNKLEAYGGIRGAITRNISFNGRLSSTKYENFMYFVNDSTYSNGNQFGIIYDDLRVSSVTGEAAFNDLGRLSVHLRAQWNVFTKGEQLEAWNQANVLWTGTAKYNLQDKLIASVELYTMGARKALSFAPLPEDGNIPLIKGAERIEVLQSGPYAGATVLKLKGFADLNFAAEYRYTKRLSLWGKVNNLFSNYQTYGNYRVQLFNAMLGATYSF